MAQFEFSRYRLRLPKRIFPGLQLRAARLEIGLSLRDVEEASHYISKELGDPQFEIPPSRLHDIERKRRTPSIYRLYTLANVYKRPLAELLVWYGVPTHSIKP